MVLQYDGFVSCNVGAKDTWGINFVQIEGEQGYIYVKSGSNALTEVKIATNAGEETINLQSEASRWLYEVQGITDIVHRDDYKDCCHRLDVMLDVIGTLEQTRKAAGIYFTGE